MKKVLVPLDGSEFSRQIIPHIRHVLDPADYRLILLHVAEEPAGVLGAPPRQLATPWPILEYASSRDAERARHPIYAVQIEENLSGALADTLADDARILRNAGYAVDVQVRFGDPVAEILDLAAAEKVDLVALATHGRTGLRRLLMGSVAEQLVRRLPKPLLLARPFDMEM